jgi:cell division septal protein FtsQ
MWVNIADVSNAIKRKLGKIKFFHKIVLFMFYICLALFSILFIASFHQQHPIKRINLSVCLSIGLVDQKP